MKVLVSQKVRAKDGAWSFVAQTFVEMPFPPSIGLTISIPRWRREASEPVVSVNFTVPSQTYSATLDERVYEHGEESATFVYGEPWDVTRLGPVGSTGTIVRIVG